MGVQVGSKMSETMGQDESLTPLFSRSNAYKQIMDTRNMTINDSTRTRAGREIRTRTTLCMTINLRASKSGDSATNFLHFDQIYELELLQWFLKFVENCFYVDRLCSAELKAVGLKPQKSGSRKPGSGAPPSPVAAAQPPAPPPKTSTQDKMTQMLFGADEDEEDEDEEDFGK